VPRLNAVNHVEHDHAGIDLDVVLFELAALRVAAPNPEFPGAHLVFA
jgi:hypothetical protein